MSGWMRHVRQAGRSLARNPGFAVLAIITLGLGIGANTASFSVIHGSVLRPLPYDDVDGLVYLSDGHENFGGAGVNQTIPNLLDLREGSRLLESSAMFTYGSGNLSTDERPERVRLLLTSSELLDVLGVAPRLGRDLALDDDVAGAERVALITDALWRRRFGADALDATGVRQRVAILEPGGRQGQDLAVHIVGVQHDQVLQFRGLLRAAACPDQRQ